MYIHAMSSFFFLLFSLFHLTENRLIYFLFFIRNYLKNIFNVEKQLLRGKTSANVGQRKRRHAGNGRFPLPGTSRARIQVDISDVLTRAFTDAMFSSDKKKLHSAQDAGEQFFFRG